MVSAPAELLSLCAQEALELLAVVLEQSSLQLGRDRALAGGRGRSTSDELDAAIVRQRGFRRMAQRSPLLLQQRMTGRRPAQFLAAVFLIETEVEVTQHIILDCGRACVMVIQRTQLPVGAERQAKDLSLLGILRRAGSGRVYVPHARGRPSDDQGALSDAALEE